MISIHFQLTKLKLLWMSFVYNYNISIIACYIIVVVKITKVVIVEGIINSIIELILILNIIRIISLAITHSKIKIILGCTCFIIAFQIVIIG